MRHLSIYFILTVFAFQGLSQINNRIQLNLIGDPAFPRLNQSYTVSVDLSSLKDSLYKSFLRQAFSQKTSPRDYSELTPIFSIYPLSKGKHEIGPLNFTYNNIDFSTDKLVFYVDDSLPTTNEALSIRNIMTSDSTFCLTIEQRIPIPNPEGLSEIQLILRDSATACQNMVQFELLPDDFTKFEYRRSENGCSIKHLIINNEIKYFYDYSNTHCFYIKKRSEHIVFSKEYFKNIPAIYNFKPINIH